MHMEIINTFRNGICVSSAEQVCKT